MTAKFRALASSIFLPQIFRSNANFSHPAVPSGFLASLDSTSIPLSFGFPNGRRPHIFISKNFLGARHLSILQTCPFRSSLPSVTRVATYIRSYTTCKHRFHYHAEFATSRSPLLAHIFLKVFSVKAPRATSIFLDTVQASLAHHRMDIQVCAA